MGNNILLIGGGGHCKSVLDSIISKYKFDKIGIIDTKDNIGKNILGISIIGSDEDIVYFYEKEQYKNAFITLGSIGNVGKREHLLNMILQLGFNIPNIIDSSAIIGKEVFLEKGIFIGKRTVVNSGSIIKKGAIINTGAIIEHDCNIGEFSHISPGTVICGGVNIGNRTHIGANSVIRQGLNIGSDNIVGIGSVVVSDVLDNKLCYGNPCREVSSI